MAEQHERDNDNVEGDLNPGVSRAHRRKRNRRWFNVALALVLLAAGATMDASLMPPWGPLARRPELVGATFARCSAGSHDYACVWDGDSLRLGSRNVRLTGIDAPGARSVKCPTEQAIAERATQRLLQMVNQGPFELVAHRFDTMDKQGRELMVARRGELDFGKQLISEGLAHRYYGIRRGWC